MEDKESCSCNCRNVGHFVSLLGLTALFVTISCFFVGGTSGELKYLIMDNAKNWSAEEIKEKLSEFPEKFQGLREHFDEHYARMQETINLTSEFPKGNNLKEVGLSNNYRTREKKGEGADARVYMRGLNTMASLSYFVEGMSLSEYLFNHVYDDWRKLTPRRVRLFMAEMLVLLEYVHVNYGLVLLDLKPENFVLTEGNKEGQGGHLVFVDLGSAKRVDDKLLADQGAEYRLSGENVVATEGFAPPEFHEGSGYTFTADYYALAMTIFSAVKWNRLHHEPVRKSTAETDNHLSWNLVDLLERMTHPTPAKRLVGKSDRMDEAIYDLMAHGFFYGVEWVAVAERTVEGFYGENYDLDFDDEIC